MHKIKRLSKKVIFILVLLLIIVSVGVFLYLNRNDSASEANSGTSGDLINLNPPTENDKKAVSETKDKIVKEDEIKSQQPTTPNGTKKTVVPVITFAEQANDIIEMGAYVPGIFEDGGTCTATFTKDSLRVVKSTGGVKEGSAVHCPIITAPSSEFTQKGSWNVLLAYNSPTATGSSETKKLEIK